AFAGRGVQRHHVTEVDGRVLLDAAALRAALRRADVLPHPVDAFDDDAVPAGQDAEHLADLPLVRAGDDDHLITTLNMPCHNPFRSLWSPGCTSAGLVHSYDFCRERNDLHEIFLAQLAGDRPENAGAAR